MTAANAIGRRLLVGSTAGISAFATYKAKYSPPHLVWDLDATLLCSVTPIRATCKEQAPYYVYDSFDQIDDDFPFDDDNETPNTRTFWRPGARTALTVCGLFAVQHVFTTAQGTYTANVLCQLDPHGDIFHTVIHRDMAPPGSMKKGKELVRIVEQVHSNNDNDNDNKTELLHRMILFDDRISNFAPQQGRNGVHVVPFCVPTEEVVASSGSTTTVLKPITITDWWRETQEAARLVGIFLVALLVSDVRSTLLPYVRSKQHHEKFPSSYSSSSS